MELERLRRIERQYESHREMLGEQVLVLELEDVLREGEEPERSKKRVAAAALKLLGG
jgi:hypothetical protein